METQEQPDDGGTSVKAFWATFLVKHAAGRTISGVKLDANFDGTDNTGTIGTTGVNGTTVVSQTYVGTAGGLETSRVTISLPIGKPGGFSCPTFSSGTRSVDAPVRVAVVDSTNEQSATVATTVRFVEDVNCGNLAGTQDFPSLNSASQNVSEVTPGQPITFTFACDDDDVDLFSSDDDCDRALPRWRRLDDGTTISSAAITGINDNATVVHTVNAPSSQGYYVFEAQLANENGGAAPNSGGNPGGWHRLGNAVVNDAASSLSGALTFSGPQVKASTPPSVNPGDAGGRRRHRRGPQRRRTGHRVGRRQQPRVRTLRVHDPHHHQRRDSHPALTATEKTQAVNTAAAGLKTVRAKITDNGALDAADNIRRQLTFTGQLRVNAVPTAANVGASTNEDTPVAVTMNGSDTDNQPVPLTYTVVSGVPAAHGTLTAGPGANQVTYTPALNFNGTTSFTYLVDDGVPSTVGAHKQSNVATATITVVPVNDAPLVDPKSATTNEDTSVNMQATGTDVEDGSTLTWSVASGPAHGGASCVPSTGLCTYTPALNFNGADSFVVRGTDSGGLSATATFSVTVNAVNDAPVANDQNVAVPEDFLNFPITLTASDVDSLVLNFTAPNDDVDHGTLSCLGESCTYSPAPDYNGPDSFTFTVSDGSLTDSGTVTIDVTPVNDAPVATDVPDAETDEDVALDLTLGGTDVDNDPLTVTSATDPANGTTTPLPANVVRYLGDLNFNGIDTYDFEISDGNGGTDTGTVVVTVNPVNDAPVVNDQTFHVTEDTPAILSMVASDVDGDVLHWNVTTPAGSGQVFGGGPDVAYAPLFNFAGTDTFVVTVDDGQLSDTAVITVIVDPVNDPPLANASVVLTSEDTTANFSLDANDPEGDTLSFTNSAPSHGGVSCVGALCTYVPDSNFNGADVFTFAVDDGNGGTDNASVTIVVAPVNDSPVASANSAATFEDAPIPIDLEATDVDGDVLTYTTTSPLHGTVIGVAPNIVYVPNTNFNGVDVFGFTAADGHGGDSSATVTVAVASINDAPVATGGTVTTPEDTPVSFQLGATDVENDTLTFTVTTPPESGSVTCDGAGLCDYDPAQDFSGTVSVGYSVSDGSLSDTSSFTILVDPQNDAPVASDSSVSTAEDVAVSIALSAADTEGDALTYAIESPPAHGDLTCSATVTDCTYTPAPNYNGPDAFAWSADDGHLGHTTATVTLDVTPVNDAPQALDVASSTDEEVAVPITLLAADVDGDDITYSVDSGPAHGSVTVAGNVATYMPAVDFNGVDTFLYRATDPSGAFTIARATITVVPLPLIGTYLTPEPAIAKIILKTPGTLNSSVVILENLTATLRTSGDVPLPGRAIKFSIGDRQLCTVLTDAQGVAKCSAQGSNLAALLNLGYRVVFDGDADHSPSAATGGLVAIVAKG